MRAVLFEFDPTGSQAKKSTSRALACAGILVEADVCDSTPKARTKNVFHESSESQSALEGGHTTSHGVSIRILLQNYSAGRSRECRRSGTSEHAPGLALSMAGMPLFAHVGREN